MKSIAFMGMCVFFPAIALGQVNLEKVAKRQKVKTEKKIENRVEKKIDKGVDKALDKAEDGITETMTEDSSSATTEKKEKSKTKANKKESAEQIRSVNHSATKDTVERTLIWHKYDFVPGNEIIFEDNQIGEKNGEFPSKWDLSGGTVENAIFDGEPVILFRRCNTNGMGGIVPLIKDSQNDYLPEEFTLEFDAYFEIPDLAYRTYFIDVKSQKKIYPDNNASKRSYIRYKQFSADGTGIATSYYPGFDQDHLNAKPGWRHLALSFNTRALKVYIDDARVLNIPNLGYNPAGITLGVHNPSGKVNGYVKNVKIAKGAVPLYDKFLTNGKFITTGIKFDTNKSTIKPESMGTIQYINSMLKEHPELKFSVEGHTDSDGDENSNQKLSELRAKAVVQKLIELGITSDRLTFRGWGESRPVSSNDQSEGKAQNRRVEFVKN